MDQKKVTERRIRNLISQKANVKSAMCRCLENDTLELIRQSTLLFLLSFWREALARFLYQAIFMISGSFYVTVCINRKIRG